MSFHVQKWPDISNGWSDIPSKKEANKKAGEKTMVGKNDGGKNRKKRKEKKGRKKIKKEKSINKRKEREKKGGRR